MKPKKSELEFTHENLLSAAAARIHKELTRAKQTQNEPIPPGWFNAEELAPALKISPCSVRRTMLIVKAPIKHFRRIAGNSTRKVAYWKP